MSQPDPPSSPPPSTLARTPLRGIPSSRAYWELKAEQMMNRIFDPAPPIDLEIGEPDRQAHGEGIEQGIAHRRQPSLGALARRLTPTPRQKTIIPAASRSRRDPSVLLLTTLGGVCIVSAASSVFFLNHWNQAQQSLREERNLLLVERLRSLGPAQPAPATPAQPSLPDPRTEPRIALAPAGEDLPPPPEEPWIQELDSLPRGERAQAPVLRVPLSPKLSTAAPAPSRVSRATGEGPPRPGGGAGAGASPAPTPAPLPTPLLVGVVGAPGRTGSAIFQLGGSSTSVNVGESIGGSGWRLRAADGDSAVIERGGEVRQISIGNGE